MIKKEDFGAHKDVVIAHFGNGTIMMYSARRADEDKSSMLLLMNQDAHPPGHETQEYVGFSTDDMPRPDIILTFDNPVSLNALIHSLIELQHEVLTKNEANH